MDVGLCQGWSQKPGVSGHLKHSTSLQIKPLHKPGAVAICLSFHSYFLSRQKVTLHSKTVGVSKMTEMMRVCYTFYHI